MDGWEQIAKEYKNEIENLWNDMLTASEALETSIDPKDIKKAVDILETSVESSEKAVYDIERFN